MKKPEDCRNIGDVREAIDELDREIIGLVSRRGRYVETAARFKTGEEDVRAPDRQKKMLEERRRWAIEENLDPDVIENLYKDLVSYFINREMEDWKSTGR